jgi:hypothetical protein
MHNSTKNPEPFLKGINLVDLIFFNDKNKIITTLQWRFFNALISVGFISDQLSGLIKVSALKRIASVTSNSDIRDTLLGLNDLRISNHAGQSLVSNQPIKVLLSGDGIRFEISKTLFELQKTSHRFISLDIPSLKALKSYYTALIYEMILGNETDITKPTSIEDLVNKLQPIKEHQGYLIEFKFLNSRVIQPAVKQINTNTAYDISLRKHRTGRLVTAISFVISRKPDYLKYQNADSTSAISELKKVGFNQEIADQVTLKYSPMHILANVDYVSKINKKNIYNLAGYVRAAISKNYAQVENSSIKSALSTNNKIVRVSTDKKLDLSDKKNIEALLNRPNIEREHITTSFELFLNENLSFLKERYLAYGFNSNSICVAFALFHSRYSAQKI